MLRWLVALLSLVAVGGAVLATAAEPAFVGHGRVTEKKIKKKQRLEVRDRARREAIADAVWRAVVDELGEPTAQANEAALREAVLPRAGGLLDGDAVIVDEAATTTTYDVTVEASIDRPALRQVLERVSLDRSAAPTYSVAVVVDEYVKRGAPSRGLASDEAPPPFAPATRGLDPMVRTFLATEERIALVVGNAAYDEGALRNPVRDATAIAARLEKLGFSAETVLDADRDTLVGAIRDFGERLSEGGTGLFFYAGHGLEGNGANYMVPVDAKIRSEADIEVESVPIDRVLAAMQGSGNRLNIVILDACRNNPYESRFRSLSRGGLAIVDPPQGTLVAFATRPHHVASDGDGEHGLYTEALLNNVGRPGLSLEDTFKAVRSQVSNATGGSQVPQEYTSLTGHFYFADADGGIPELDAPPPPRGQSTTFFNVVAQDPAALLRSGTDAPSGVAIERQLKARRIPLVDPAAMAELRGALQGDTAKAPMVTTLADIARLGGAATDFGSRYAADAIVVGATVIRPDGKVAEGHRAYASLAARLVDAATGEVLASSARNATGLGADQEAAQRSASRRVGEIVGEDLVDGLVEHWRARERDGWPLTLRITGNVGTGLADAVAQTAESIEGVRSATVRLVSDESIEIRLLCGASPRLVRPRVLEAFGAARATRDLQARTYATGIWTWEAR